MILSNYWKAMRILEDVSSGGTINKDLNILGISGSSVGNIDIADDGMSGTFRERPIANARLRTANISIRLGKGTGEVAASDYALFDDCTASISSLVFNSLFNSESEAYSQVITITGANSTANEIILTEVGICKKFYIYIDGNSDRPLSQEVMLAKILLESPVTVPANGTFRIILEWKEQ